MTAKLIQRRPVKEEWETSSLCYSVHKQFNKAKWVWELYASCATLLLCDDCDREQLKEIADINEAAAVLKGNEK